jgi:hypothetical protein
MFKQLTTLEELAQHFDDFVEGGRIMLQKTKEVAQSPENLMRIVLYDVTHDVGFVLIHTDENGKLDAFIVATHILPLNYIEFIALWCRPGLLKVVHEEGGEYLEKWARSRGAQYILAGLQRAPEKFFKWFHEPLGYKKIGIVIKKDL